MNILVLVFCFPRSSQEVSVRHCANPLWHCTDGERLEELEMSLSAARFWSLLGSPRRLRPFWTRSVPQVPPEEPRVGTVCAASSCRVSCPAFWQGVPCTLRSAHASRQPRTSGSDFSAYQLLSHLEHSLFPNIFPLLFLIRTDLWITLFWLCASYSVAVCVVIPFTEARDWKQLETWKKGPLFVFCFDGGGGTPVCKQSCLLSCKEVS